jgi:2'-5' RNA ligase
MGMIRFAIITVPPPEVAGQIDALRRPLCELSNSYAALAYPPHVTLRTGVIVPQEAINDFLWEFGRLLDGWTPFMLRTDGLFSGSCRHADNDTRIVCYKVLRDEVLSRLNRRLLSYGKYRKSNRTHFDPHVTLVFDDLTRENFDRLSRHLGDDSEIRHMYFEWVCDNVSLYVKTGNRWEPFHVYRFGEVYR